MTSRITLVKKKIIKLYIFFLKNDFIMCQIISSLQMSLVESIYTIEYSHCPTLYYYISDWIRLSYSYVVRINSNLVFDLFIFL